MGTSTAWKKKALEKFKGEHYFKYEQNLKVWKVAHLVFCRSYIFNGNKQRVYIGMTMFWNTLNDKIDFVNE